MFKMYYYGCKSHNTDFGAVPVKGILMWRPSKDDKYYRTLVYSRRLSHAEMEQYQLDYIGCEDWIKTYVEGTLDCNGNPKETNE